MLAQFTSPFTRAYLESPQLLQDALEQINIGPFQSDGELLCMWFLPPSRQAHDNSGVTLRSWSRFKRVLAHLDEYSVTTKSVTPSDAWLQWLQDLEEKVPFTPINKLDLMRSLWSLMEKTANGKPSHTYTLREWEMTVSDRKLWHGRNRPPPITQLQVLKWRHWKPGQLKDLEPTTQRGPYVQMAREKHVIVLSLLKDLADGKVFSHKAIEKALGRIQWATATCPLAKPFLQPFWQWKSACKNAGQPGKLVRSLAVLLAELFSKQFPQMSPFSPWSQWTGATDASAESFGSTWIGGWFSDLTTPTKDQVYWFQYQVTQDLHPWAFKRNDPQKRIAALELYGTLFLALLLMDRPPASSCRLHIPLVSDNQGNVYSILNNATRRMPSAIILMELVYQIYQAGHMLAPTHSRRDENKWADGLTHPSPVGFCPSLKVDLSPVFPRFVLIPKLLESQDKAILADTETHP